MSEEVKGENGCRVGEVGKEKAQRVSSLLPPWSSTSALLDRFFSA